MVKKGIWETKKEKMGRELEIMEKFLRIRKLKKRAMLWDDSQEENYFLHICQLNGKHPRIQYRKDINSMGKFIPSLQYFSYKPF